MLLLSVFFNRNLPSIKGKSNVTYPMRGRVNRNLFFGLSLGGLISNKRSNMDKFV
jgi:hypothetical protein